MPVNSNSEELNKLNNRMEYIFESKGLRGGKNTAVEQLRQDIMKINEDGDIVQSSNDTFTLANENLIRHKVSRVLYRDRVFVDNEVSDKIVNELIKAKVTVYETSLKSFSDKVNSMYGDVKGEYIPDEVRSTTPEDYDRKIKGMFISGNINDPTSMVYPRGIPSKAFIEISIKYTIQSRLENVSPDFKLSSTVDEEILNELLQYILFLDFGKQFMNDSRFGDLIWFQYIYLFWKKNREVNNANQD